jgi:metal-responsive CopG/Arc/MetJ family transcriptional regulator
MREDSSVMARITVRLPDSMLDAIDAAAQARHATRSATIRACLEDAIDLGELPETSPNVAEALDRLRDDGLDRLRELTNG